MKKNYYVAASDNGGMITRSYTQAQQCRTYLRGHFHIQGFFDQESAQEYLFDHLDDVLPYNYTLPPYFPLGRVITRKWFSQQKPSED